MGGAVVRLFPLEMVLLGIFELFVSFVFIYAMFASVDGEASFGSFDLACKSVELSAALALIIASAASAFGLYRHDVCRSHRRLVISGIVAGTLSFPLILLVSGWFDRPLNAENTLLAAGLVALWVGLTVFIRVGFTSLAPRVTRRILVVGSGERAARLRLRLLKHGRSSFQPVDTDYFLSDSDLEADAKTARHRRISGIILADDEPASALPDALIKGNLRGLPIFSDRAFQEIRLGRIELDEANPNWRLSAETRQREWVWLSVKRLCDIVIGLTLLFATLPLLALMTVLIKLDSPGPVFYRQERTGLDGKPFTLLKLRSMSVNAEALGVACWAQKGDARVTRTGAFMRASRIDELPQLLNVLLGEMSLIGPRPERPVFVADLATVIPLYNHRFNAKPGLTGWAQVNFPYGASVEDAREKLAYDLYYIKNQGLLLDLMILLATIRVVLFREGSR